MAGQLGPQGHRGAGTYAGGAVPFFGLAAPAGHRDTAPRHSTDSATAEVSSGLGERPRFPADIPSAARCANAGRSGEALRATKPNPNGAPLMPASQTERVENPHRVEAGRPLLPPHEFRPARLGIGVALAGLGGAFLLQQLGVITMGAAPTIAALVVAGAAVLTTAAASWSRR